MTLSDTPRLFAADVGRDAELLPSLSVAASLRFRQYILPDWPAPLDLAQTADLEYVSTAVLEAQKHNLDVWLNLNILEIRLDHPLVAENPAAYAVRPEIARGLIDPRNLPHATGKALLRVDQPGAGPVLEWWLNQISRLGSLGIRGFILPAAATTSSGFWQKFLGRARVGSQLSFAMDLRNLSPRSIPILRGAGFDWFISRPLKRQEGWLSETFLSLTESAPVIVALDRGVSPNLAERLQHFLLSIALGDGLLMPSGYQVLREPDDTAALSHAIGDLSSQVFATGSHRLALTAKNSAVAAFVRREHPESVSPHLILANNQASDQAFDPALIAKAGGQLDLPSDTLLRPREVRFLPITPSIPVLAQSRNGNAGVSDATVAPRIIVEGIEPRIDSGDFPIKRVVGDWLVIEADIFTDGHEKIAAEMLFKAADEISWTRVPMEPLLNDRWVARILLQRVGPHSFALEAWLDRWGGFIRDFEKKRAAGVDLSLDILDGLAMVADMIARATPETTRELRDYLAKLETASPEIQKPLFISPLLAEAIANTNLRPFKTKSDAQRVDVEREAARFASWYELFPRSETSDRLKPGRLLDVVGRLPAIKRMGFDVLYFPPIHPIGSKNRKGRNNILKAEAGDPGSPYAIGSSAGGHDAVNPELGTLKDFSALLSAARAEGLEIALDFAVQCSPDHPWLQEHPEWFTWRPDGSMKYAENPPKRYEDIVNVDFYAPGAVPGLWLALRDIVLHWAVLGVRLFRVDNPHTKPLPFWEWMIADIRAVYPDVVFLAEAFTRPKLMYHLAKAGFSQSYTYFTWRNTKAELTAYMKELTETKVKEYFRPHFFVNTPDINPFFLQQSGRSGFLIRAALATTLSGLWGMYSGFELCEAESLPGKEEYLDSEKYEVRPRDWTQRGNIVREITQLNMIRKAEPALQSHLGLTFYDADNDQILYFGKTAAGDEGKILVAISLDPRQPQEARFEVPLWEWELADDATIESIDLLSKRRAQWRGKFQNVRLTPDAPYAIWRVHPIDKV